MEKMNGLVLFVLAFAVLKNVESAETPMISEVRVHYHSKNQIIFREKGTIINKATFVHVKYTFNLTNVFSELDKFVAALNETNFKETKLSAESLLPFMKNGSSINSIWEEGDMWALYQKRAADGAAISRWLMDLFKGHSTELTEILETTPEDYNPGNSDLAHNRNKRAFGGIAVIFTEVNRRKIKHIEGQLDEFSNKYNVLIDGFGLMNDHYRQLIFDVQILKNLKLLVANRNYHKILAHALVTNSMIQTSINKVKSIITAGQRKQVSSDLIHGEDLKVIFQKVKEKAIELNCDMILEKPADIYGVEASYILDEEQKTFTIFIHIPIVEKDENLSLMEYVRFPILQSISTNSTIIPKVGEEKYIAVAATKMEVNPERSVPHLKFRTLSETDIQSCLRIKNTYICGGRNTLQTDIENSCIGGLWLRDHDIISRSCDMEISYSKEFVAKMGSNRWMIFSPKPLTRQIYCGSKVKDNINFWNQTEIEMPENCKVTLRSNILTTDVNVFVDYKIKVFEWPFMGNIFEGFVKDEKDLNLMIQELVATKSNFGLKDLSHLKHYYVQSSDQFAEIWEHLDVFGVFAWFSNLGIILAVCIVLLGFYYCYHCGCFRAISRCCRRRLRRNSEDSDESDGDRNRERGRNRNRNQSRDRNLGNVENARVPSLRRDLSHSPRRMENVIPDSDAKLLPTAPFMEKPMELDLPEVPYDLNPLTVDECNPGPMMENMKLEDFVCNHHVKRGARGYCMGYFKN